MVSARTVGGSDLRGYDDTTTGVPSTQRRHCLAPSFDGLHFRWSGHRPVATEALAAGHASPGAGICSPHPRVASRIGLSTSDPRCQHSLQLSQRRLASQKHTIRDYGRCPGDRKRFAASEICVDGGHRRCAQYTAPPLGRIAHTDLQGKVDNGKHTEVLLFRIHGVVERGEGALSCGAFRGSRQREGEGMVLERKLMKDNRKVMRMSYPHAVQYVLVRAAHGALKIAEFDDRQPRRHWSDPSSSRHEGVNHSRRHRPRFGARHGKRRGSSSYGVNGYRHRAYPGDYCDCV